MYDLSLAGDHDFGGNLALGDVPLGRIVTTWHVREAQSH